MILISAAACKHVVFRLLVCPFCEDGGHMVGHGPYLRGLVVLEGPAAVLKTMSVNRVRCTACGKTHAIIPDDVVPRCAASVEVCMLVVVALALRSRSPSELASLTRLSASTISRIGSDAERLAQLVNATVWATALDLVLLADDPRLATRFAEPHGTAPFSRCAIYLSAPVETSGTQGLGPRAPAGGIP